MKGFKLGLSFFIFLLCSCSNTNTKEKVNIRILTGESNGFYYSFLNSINKELRSNSDTILDLINTPGSTYNLKMLMEKRAEMAVIQGDMIPEEDNVETFGIRGVTPLFPEYVYIFSILPPGNAPRKEKIKIRTIDQLYIGSQQSGTNFTARRICQLAGIGEQKLISDNPLNAIGKIVQNFKFGDGHIYDTNSFYFLTLSKDHPLIKDISDGYLDDSCIGINGKKEKITDIVYNRDFFGNTGSDLSSSNKTAFPILFLELPDVTIRDFLSLYPIYKAVQCDIKGIGNNGFSFVQPCFPTYIITQTEVHGEIVKKFLSLISKSSIYKSSIKSSSAIFDKENPKWYIPIHPEVFSSELLKNEKLISSQSTLFRYAYLIFYILSILFLFALALPENVSSFFHIIRWNLINRFWLIIVSKKGIIVVIFFCLLFLLGFLLIFQIEKINADLYGYSSRIANMTPLDILLWGVVQIVAGIETGILPTDPTSLLILLLTDLTVRVILPILVLVFAAQWVRNFLQKKGGLGKRSFNNHTILIGWNFDSPNLINELISLKSDIKILIISEISGNPVLDNQLSSKNVGFLRGSPLDQKVLIQANYTKASHILYLINDRNEPKNKSINLISIDDHQGASPPHFSDHLMKHSVNKDSSFKNNNNSSYGYPVSFNKFYNNLIVSNNIKNPAKFTVLNFSNKYKDIYNALHLESSVNNFSTLYSTLIQNLFSGSKGMYTQIDKWLSNIRSDNTFSNVSPGDFRELSLKKSDNNIKLQRKFKNSYSSFIGLLSVYNALSICKSYKELSNNLLQDNYRLLGLKVTLIKGESQNEIFLIDPYPITDIKSEDDKFQVLESTLYLMKC